jgi:hypothetical protein
MRLPLALLEHATNVLALLAAKWLAVVTKQIG